MKELYQTTFATPLGEMIAIGDDKALHFLQFRTHKKLGIVMGRVMRNFKAELIEGESKTAQQIEGEVADYFAGKSAKFKTNYVTDGTPYQRLAWDFLCAIPAGQTRNYTQEAETIKAPKKKACARAAGNANKANPLALVVPCHRVIAIGGGMSGYVAGESVKAKLLAHEQKYFA